MPTEYAIPALGLAYALSYWVGLASLAHQLRRRLGGLDGYLVVRTYVRVMLASAAGGGRHGGRRAMAAEAVRRAGRRLHHQPGDRAHAGSAFGAAGYLVGVRLFRITEVSDVLRLVAGRRS